MKEGRLSSGLMKRYGIPKENEVGKVLWHSLNENGIVGLYDMKFGNIVIRNILAEEVIGEGQPHKRDEEHGIQEIDDPERVTSKLEEQ